MFGSLRVSRLGLLALTALVVGTTASAAILPAAAAAAPARSAPTVPTIAWTDCAGGLQCATAAVPLDYDRPSATAISIALIRLPASDPGQRIGSLFVNPGGPGGSGVDFLRGIASLIPAELRSRYDIVGFDPRGIAHSTPLRCFDTQQEAADAASPLVFPVTPDEQQIVEKADRTVAEACAARGGAIMDHMSTANVARDLDLLRQAVGDARLNYLGYSYGSYLGQTYANMFPSTVGAFVIDGVVDPIAWSTGRGTTAQTQPFSTRLRSDAGADRTLQQFFYLCDRAGADCAFSGGARARFDALAARLRATPLVVTSGSQTTTITYAALIGVTLRVMYSSQVWKPFAGLLAQLAAAASDSDIGDSIAAVRAALGGQPTAVDDYVNAVEGPPGVACSDSDNPLEYDAWPAAAQQADAQYRYFGRIWTWFSSECQPWPGQDNDRYTGPWNSTTATPVLVVGNYFDPATRYQGAVTASRLLPGSRLLSYAGWGHTAFLSAGNDCVNAAVVQYLLTTQLPASGTVCQPAGSPFDPAPTGQQSRLLAVPNLPLPLLPEVVRPILQG